MREKFYFDSPELTRVAMLMANTISDADLKDFTTLSEQIGNLIGMDDDLTISQMKEFLRTERLTTPTAILAADITEVVAQLHALHEQKITSTHYRTE